MCSKGPPTSKDTWETGTRMRTILQMALIGISTCWKHAARRRTVMDDRHVSMWIRVLHGDVQCHHLKWSFVWPTVWIVNTKSVSLFIITIFIESPLWITFLFNHTHAGSVQQFVWGPSSILSSSLSHEHDKTFFVWWLPGHVSLGDTVPMSSVCCIFWKLFVGILPQD